MVTQWCVSSATFRGTTLRLAATKRPQRLQYDSTSPAWYKLATCVHSPRSNLVLGTTRMPEAGSKRIVSVTAHCGHNHQCSFVSQFLMTWSSRGTPRKLKSLPS